MRYRLYALGPSGEIVSGTDLAASSDSEALHEATKHTNSRVIEIWQGNRQVALLNAARTQPIRPQLIKPIGSKTALVGSELCMNASATRAARFVVLT